MISKKVICCTLLFYLFPLSGCLKLIDLTKKPIEPSQLPFIERQAKYKQDVETVKNTLHERRNSCRIFGNSPAGISFLYSVYTAKTGTDFDNALMAKGERYIQLYVDDRVEECSGIGIAILAEDVSFVEKKKFIQKLVGGIHYDEPHYVSQYTFTPTLQDKEFAFFATYKEYAPSIIKGIMSYVRDDNFMSGIPTDVKNYIAKLLFWVKFKDKEFQL